LEEEKMKKNVESAGKFEVSSLASIISNIVLVKSSNQQLQYMQKLVFYTKIIKFFMLKGE